MNSPDYPKPQNDAAFELKIREFDAVQCLDVVIVCANAPVL